MNKLYEKSPLWFSLAWIIVYVVGTSIAEEVSRALGVEKSITVLFLLALCALALAWLGRHKLYREYGLCKSEIRPSKFLYYIPLAVVASCNLWYGIAQNLPLYETVLYILSMVCVGFLEELIFRGFLFKAMCPGGLRSAIIVSSVTFGIGHIVNLFNGSGAQLIPNLCQVVSAIAFGFLFVVIFYKGKSLWPCIATHSLLNALSVFANEENQTQETEILVSLILCVIAVSYAAFLWKKLRRPDRT